MMKRMGIRHENWQVEVVKDAWVVEMDNINVDLHEIGKGRIDFAQNSDRW